MKQYVWTILTLGAMFVAAAAWWLAPVGAIFKQPATWQGMAEPGALSISHAHLKNNCAACHTSVTGIETTKCIVCHANNESLLQRQPTAFHSSISSCTECHLEHQGIEHRPTNMSHEALARIGLQQLNEDATDTENRALATHLATWAGGSAPPHPHISIVESTLNCVTCHGNDDHHFKLFGQDCAQCHATEFWTIPEFRHPSATSMDCAQCHQAPPSHYMMHFKMISARVAGKPHARVDQCFQCHQTTSWNDILGAGWYKHH
ncbi:hypothetical protein [Symmachiella dynata]|uniref:hypothetical protein n=1 Tax=Symmachiella dynata TaxID=2527995 RepID=UPI003C7060F4